MRDEKMQCEMGKPKVNALNKKEDRIRSDLDSDKRNKKLE